MEKDNHAYLHLILDATRKIQEYLGQMSLNDFLIDSKTESAVIMQIQIIGELSKKIPEEIRSKIDVPWKEISGLRDMVSHDYFSLDVEAIWNTATKDVQELEQKIKKYLDIS
ncbi:MAG: DUF86 domain-containing protein [Candidatus Parcubacteria bacterium]|nr:DUF86 domain-containing protein [Candidatus Parcubacteria bacterium]